MSGPSSPLARVAGVLRCPHCGAGPLTIAGAVVRCPGGHAFDLARQGYVSLLPGGARAGQGDTAAMVAARAAFLATGHYAPITAALAEACAGAGAAEGPLVDVGAGTGHHLAGVLDANPGAAGLAVDRSPAAARRAARAHPRMAAIVADAWRGLPVATGAAAAVLHVFAPRDGADTARVLRPDGVAVVVAPARAHLAELVDALGLVGVDARKRERLEAGFGGHLRRRSERRVTFELALSHDEVRALVGMGPSARHVDGATLGARLRALPEPVAARADVELSTWVRRDAGPR